MRQGQGSQRFDLPRRVNVSSRKGIGVVELLTGIVAFGLGLFFGWMLHRERVGASGTRSERNSDLATTALAGASARLEEADQDVVELRTQLTDAQHMLDESAAAIAELEYQLAECRGEEVDETLAISTDEPVADERVADEPFAGEPIDAAADDATTPPSLTDVDIDEADVTEEVIVAEPARDAIPGTERTQQDLSAIYDETEAIPVQDDTRSGPGIDDTQTMVVDETEAIELPGDETEVIERPPAEAESDARKPAGDVEDDQASTVEEPIAPAVDEQHGDEPAVAAVRAEPAAVPAEEEVGQPAAAPVEEPVAEEASEPVAADAQDPFVPPPGVEHDNLQRIRGVGPAMERLLNEQGLVTFRQLAVLDDAGIEKLQSRLPGFTGRIRRDRWIDQARRLHTETHGDQP